MPVMAALKMTGRGVGISDALKAVETLFETQTIVEIREVETKTRTDIEEKQKQLRLLVGNSYRDLISSADTILEMAKTCDTVLQNFSNVQAGLASLSNSASKGDELKVKGQEASKRRFLHAMGGRIKYLVDTPEIIWGCLDTHSYLDAARRFLRAAEVHSQLEKHASAELQSKFPLVKRQWPGIRKFRNHIQEHVVQRLNQQDLLSAEDCVVALAAAASLQDLDSSRGLAMLLESRQRAIREVIDRETRASSDHSSSRAARALKEALHQIQETVWQVGRLFLPHEASGHTALLPQVLEEEGLSGELLFGLFQEQADSDTTPEAEAWKALSTGIRQRVEPLSQQDTTRAVSRFLQDVAQVFSSVGRELVAASCSSAAALAGLEAELRAAIMQWRHQNTEEEQDPLRSPRRSLQPSTPKRGFPGGSGVLEEQLPSSWEAACEWVLTKRTSLWDLVLEPSFVQVSKNLIEKGLEELKGAVHDKLADCWQRVANEAAAPPGSYRASSWPEAARSLEVVPNKKRRKYGESGRSPSTAQEGPNQSSWRLQLPLIQSDFNARLRSVLSDTLLLLSEQGSGKEQQPRRGYSGRLFALPPSQLRGRAAALQPFLQQSSHAAASGVLGHLSRHLDQLPAAADGLGGAAVVEQALLIGRLCLALGSSETLLPAVLGNPEAWKDAVLSSAPAEYQGGSEGGKPRTSSTKSSFPELQRSFRSLAERAHSLWASWGVKAIGEELRKSTLGDAALISTLPLRVWEETVVSQEGEGEEAQEETRFQLPAMPSPGVLMSLLAAGRELQRAGGALPGSAAPEILKQDLAIAALTAFREALKEGSALDQSLSEKGVLQLLFDLRFLKDVLVGSNLAQAGEASRGNEADSFQHDYDNLQTSLQDRLDPIDWAIYGVYLWQNEAAFYQRVRVLFGSLMLFNSIHSEVLTKATPSAEANILQFAPTSARFGYLPISTPSATASGLRQLPTSGVPRSGPEDQRHGNDYSFANLGGMKAGSSLAREAEAGGSTTFEALQSRFTTQRLGALGSLLGDRAAEVTAMAQQSFNDMSLPTAFTTALGGSSGSATGLLASFRGFRGGADAE